MKNKKYIDAENFILYNDDCFKRLKKLEQMFSYILKQNYKWVLFFVVIKIY